MRAPADHRVRSKLMRIWRGDAVQVAQVNAVPAKRCCCVARVDAGRFAIPFLFAVLLLLWRNAASVPHEREGWRGLLGL